MNASAGVDNGTLATGGGGPNRQSVDEAVAIHSKIRSEPELTSIQRKRGIHHVETKPIIMFHSFSVRIGSKQSRTIPSMVSAKEHRFNGM